MRIKRTISKTTAIVVTCLGLGCASTTAPPGWLHPPAESQQETYGAWARVLYDQDQTEVDARGELIAVDSDTLFVLSPLIKMRHPEHGSRAIVRNGFKAPRAASVKFVSSDTLVAIPRLAITRARLTTYDTRSGTLGLWSCLGVLSTLSHGVVCVISAPLWLLVGAGVTASHSFKSREEYPYIPWEELRKFSRFPSGLPPGLDRSALHPKPLT